MMTTKAKQTTPATAYPAPVVLFGIDSRGKPKGARFGAAFAGLAMKAASQLQLRVLPSNDPKIADVAARLPVGRVHATGRTFVPFIRRDLYDKLVAVAAIGKDNPSAPLAATATAGASAPKPSGSGPNLPDSWDKIGLGDQVLAQESPDDGWYDAIVLEAHGDMFTLRWRDYPSGRRIVRHRNRLGLLYPGAKPGVEAGKSVKPTAAAKQDKPLAASHATNAQTLPKDWLEISVGHLVLARDDGPWESWWEATPIERAGDGFKLRWRDYANLTPITRSRFDLALICPEAA
jgi:hypothetical protein